MLINGKRQSGFTLTELMISTVVGMIAVGGVLSVYLGTVKSSSEMLKASKLNQELSAAMEIMVSDIRRAGYWTTATPGNLVNPFTQAGTNLSVDGSPMDMSGSCILYTYDATYRGGTAGSVDTTDYFGFKKDGDVVRMLKSGNSTTDCGSGTWESLTDSDTIIVDTLTFDIDGTKCLNTTTNAQWDSICLDASSPAPSGYVASSTGDILVETRQIRITLEGHLKGDASVRKTIQTSVRVRNDRIYRQS